MIPMVSGYLIFVFTALNGKWAKELKSPYTYLIPDSAFRKLMNATAMQHVQSLVNACLITVPGGVVMGMAPMEILLCIVFYVVLSANKLYALAVAEVVVGATLGAFGRQHSGDCHKRGCGGRRHRHGGGRSPAGVSSDGCIPEFVHIYLYGDCSAELL